MPEKNNVLILRAELSLKSPLCQMQMITKPVVRDVTILSGQSLYQLAEAIIGAFGFDFDHAFGFFSNITTGWQLNQSEKMYELFADMKDQGIEPTGAESVEKTKISEVWKNIGDKMLFLFDYGDDWRFIVKLIDFGAKKAKAKYPRVIKTTGKAPRQYPIYK